MKDLNKLAVLIGLIVLVVVVSGVLPRFDFLRGLDGFGSALPWIIIGLFFLTRFGGCCGRRRCHSANRDVEAEA